MSFAYRIGAAIRGLGRWVATRIGRGIVLRPMPPAEALPSGTHLAALAAAAEQGLAENLIRLDRRLPPEVSVLAKITAFRVPVLAPAPQRITPAAAARPDLFRPAIWLRPAARDGGRISRWLKLGTPARTRPGGH